MGEEIDVAARDCGGGAGAAGDGHGVAVDVADVDVWGASQTGFDEGVVDLVCFADVNAAGPAARVDVGR